MTALASAVQQKYLSREDLKGLNQFPQASLLILGEKSPALTGKISSWSGQDRQKLDSLLEWSSTKFRSNGKDDFFVGSALERLALKDKLFQKDLHGTTLLDNLVELKTCAANLGPAGEDLAAWSIVHAAYSKRTYHQIPTKGTCGASSIGYTLWESDPSQIVRSLKEWFVEGSTTLRGGVSSERPSEYQDPTVTTPLPDQVLQSSMMNLADPEYVYSLTTDRFNKKDGTVRSEPRGLLQHNQDFLLNSLSTKRWHSTKLTAQELKTELGKAGQALPAALDWNSAGGEHSLHMVAVTKINSKWVYVRDPHGEHGLKLPSGQQQILGEGYQRFPRQEFEERLNHVFLPENQ